ncbi:MAG TPA: hypothetical protein VER79_05405 [Candidatus Limnocylindrales bacterium]|nr:hypothetical protein [Candidatus Limnocylindrales bacterium]
MQFFELIEAESALPRLIGHVVVLYENGDTLKHNLPSMLFRPDEIIVTTEIEAANSLL